MKIIFNKQTHTYYLNGYVIPSVTQIIKDAGLIYTSNYTSEHARKGSEIHEEIASIIDGMEPISAHGRVFFDFMKYIGYRGNDWEPEKVVYDVMYGYAGTVDISGLVNGKKSVIEVKTGSPASWHKLQAAAYAHALDVDYAYLLYLTDSSFKLIPIVVCEEFNKFKNLLVEEKEEGKEEKEEGKKQEAYDSLALEYEKLSAMIHGIESLYVDEKKEHYSSYSSINKKIKEQSEEYEQKKEEIRGKLVSLLTTEKGIIQKKCHTLIKKYRAEIEDSSLIPRDYLTPDIEKINSVVKSLGKMAESAIRGIKVTEEFSLRITKDSR